ncbi:uncharacterized protein LOC102809160, partial [Saccoglossus kowalevskii]|uniref:Nucleosome-remodeling factor subunit BPTF-like n=1 Tax=Saccoglossus kowalevskii TaxID=10224 RepID=A0ABM0MZL7_SACKO
VWKQKGEEYRIVSGGGWRWVSSVRRNRPLPAPSPAKILLEKSITKMKQMKEEAVIKAKEVDKLNFKTPMSKEKNETDDKEDHPDKIVECTGEPMETQPSTNVECNVNHIKSISLTKKEKKTCEELKIDEDVINVSKALAEHTHYKKIVKRSRLDGFLDRRQKQFAVEMKEYDEKMKKYLAYKKALEEKKNLEERILMDKKNPPLNKVLPVIKKELDDTAFTRLKSQKVNVLLNGENADDMKTFTRCYSPLCVKLISNRNDYVCYSTQCTGNQGLQSKHLSKASLNNKEDMIKTAINSCVVSTSNTSIIPTSNVLSIAQSPSSVNSQPVTSTTSLSPLTQVPKLITGTLASPKNILPNTTNSAADNVTSSLVLPPIPKPNLNIVVPSSVSKSSDCGPTIISGLNTSLGSRAIVSSATVQTSSTIPFTTSLAFTNSKSGLQTITTLQHGTMVQTTQNKQTVTPSDLNIKSVSIGTTNSPSLIPSVTSSINPNKPTLVTSQNTVVSSAMASLLKSISTSLISVDCPKEYTSAGKIYLAKFMRARKSTKKLAKPLPTCCKFTAKSGLKSIFVLRPEELRKISRRGGKYEVPSFNYNAKTTNVNWNYPAPRCRFKTAWRYRVQTLRSLSAAGLLLRIVWACVRWDDLAVKPPFGGNNTVTTEDDITTTEIVKKRDVPPDHLRSEYLVRKIVCPLGGIMKE